jgi:hypothetical protein
MAQVIDLRGTHWLCWKPHALARNRSVNRTVLDTSSQGNKIDGLELPGLVSAVAGGGVSNFGRPRMPTRLMVPQLNLKHTFSESNGDVI